MKRAILIATGQEPDLQALTSHRPTPLLKVGGKAIITHIIEFLIQRGIEEIEVVLHHFPEQIEELLGDGERWGIPITSHLVKNADCPFSTLRLAAEGWEEEQVLIGQGDYLPCENLSQLLRENWSSPVLIWDNREVTPAWTGWGIVPTEKIRELNASSSQNDLVQSVGTHHEVPLDCPAIGTRHFKELQLSQQLFLDQAVEGLLMPTSTKQMRPGVWVSSSAQVHANVHIEAPVYVGENSQVREGAHIGPYAVIEDHCIVAKGSEVSHSTICHYSYVGEGLELHNCLVDRNVLVNLTHDSKITVSDDFILCGLNPPSIGSKAVNLLERVGAGLLLCLASPILLPMLMIYPQRQEEVVQLPSKLHEGEWETFSWMSLDCRWRWLRRLPSLYHVVRGDAHFVGLPPRAKSEVRELSSDWRNLYLHSRIGFIGQSDISCPALPTEDELYSAEVYYTANRSAVYDLKLFAKYLGKRLRAGKA